jgi:Zn-dependent M28 family amino/carboxypeptidase
MLFRMAERGQQPRMRVDADAEQLGEVPQFNVVAELKGTELPDEYIVLSAHLDSWHAATGATDNGTGTIMMLEAMRILKETYPEPRRTILVGHWGPEEMGLIGSRVFTEDHPEVLDGLQVLFNQDNGTWRIGRIEGQGFLYAGQHIGRWISLVPAEISEHITLEFPGAQNNRGSDHVAFLCHGVPAFRLQSAYDEYRQYTWHTNRDTYDKIVFDDLKENATLAAMLAYAASEDPERVPRDRAVLPIDPRSGEPRAWVQCRPARRRSGG